MKSAYDIIIKPILTEKSYADMAEKKYTFQVDILNYDKFIISQDAVKLVEEVYAE
jgi:ribosomal protein L23